MGLVKREVVTSGEGVKWLVDALGTSRVVVYFRRWLAPGHRTCLFSQATRVSCPANGAQFRLRTSLYFTTP
jgi:hypothetical protein